MPKVWNKRHPNVPKDAIYVGRPTKWGNPFSHLRSRLTDTIPVATREEAIEQYKKWFWMHGPTEDISELQGKDLVCWCSPAACHADFLLEVANS